MSISKSVVLTFRAPSITVIYYANQHKKISKDEIEIDQTFVLKYVIHELTYLQLSKLGYFHYPKLF